MRIALLSGAYPPALDGIGDFTRLLARDRSRREGVRVFTSLQAEFRHDDGVTVSGVFDPSKPSSICRLEDAVRSGGAPSRLIVQYNPFGFGPRGFNPWLPGVLRRISRLCAVDIMFHETFVPKESLPFRVMRLWQVPQFRALCRLGARLYASAGRWIPEIERASGRTAQLVPAGSNVPRSALGRDEARARLGIAGTAKVLVVFGSAHPSRLLTWIASAAAAIRSVHKDSILLYVGSDGKILRRAMGPGFPFIDCGVLDDRDVGDRLVAGDLMLAPFVDGLSTRRGSVVAAFQHGLPVASTSAEWTDRILIGQPGIFLSPVHQGESAFCRLAVSGLDAAVPDGLTAFFDAHFSWPVLAARLFDGGEGT